MAVLVAILGVLAAPSVRADANGLQFVINDRLSKVPAARVRWSFALALPPGPSTSVTIGGATATLGGGWKTVTTTSGDDRFRIDSTSALSNGVTILYEPRSHFAYPDLCHLAPSFSLSVFPKVVTLNFAGPAITQHAMVTYTVSGSTAAATINCNLAKRRVDSAAAGVQIAPPGAVALARHPLDVVLVLDKSGSMGWELPGAPYGSLPTRWTVLNTALDQFEALWEQAAYENIVNDRIGLIHFDSAVTPGNFAGSIFKKRGTNPIGPTHDWNEVIAAAKAKVPGGSTAIGQGLKLAYERFCDATAPGCTDPVTMDGVIVLMTDGEQNVDPYIQKLAGTDNYALRTALPLSDPPVTGDELYQRGIPVQTIAMGSPGATFAQVLDGVASQTAGTSIVTTTASGMSTAMQDVLLQALKGNTLGLLVRTEGTVTPPSVVSAPIPLQLDASVRRATAVLNWSGRRGLFNIVFQPPGGGNAITPTISKQGDNWLVASVDLPANGPNGTWTAFVRGRDLSSASSYQLSVYALDADLKYSLSLGHQRIGAGDGLPLAVEVSYKGVPLTNIPSGIRVRPARPGEGLGNILHASTADSKIPLADQSAYSAKVNGLAVSAKLLDRIVAKPSGDELILSDTGMAGDAAAGDGIYSAIVPNTQVPGRYHLDVVLEWDDPRTGKVKRIESVEREVHVVPDALKTQVAITAGTAVGSFVIQVTPRDRFGNYTGPGYQDHIQVRLNGNGRVGNAIDPQSTGVYGVDVVGASAPSYTLMIDNIPVRKDAPLVPGISGQTGGKDNCGCAQVKCVANNLLTENAGDATLVGSLLMVGSFGVGGLAFLRRRKPEAHEEEQEDDKV
jgi:hypothetical protein